MTYPHRFACHYYSCWFFIFGYAPGSGRSTADLFTLPKIRDFCGMANDTRLQQKKSNDTVVWQAPGYMVAGGGVSHSSKLFNTHGMLVDIFHISWTIGNKLSALCGSTLRRSDEGSCFAREAAAVRRRVKTQPCRRYGMSSYSLA